MSSYIPLFKHQEYTARFILGNGGSGAIWHEMGLGKTRTALEIFSALRAKNPRLVLFVVCPISLIRSAWQEDITRFTGFNSVDLYRTNKLLPADIYLINFESIIAKSRIPLLDSFLSYPDIMCVIDESSKIKNFKAQVTKKLLAMRSKFKHRIVMSGTPAPNSEAEYWSQVAFVSPYILGDNFYAFRNNFFHLGRGNQIMQGQIVTRASARELFSKGWKYQILPHKRVALLDRVGKISHWAKKKDCLDLPDMVDEIRSVEMTKEQRKIYNQMKNDCITSIKGKDVVAQVALTRVMKLRQITSGFAITADHEATDMFQETVNPFPSPKLQELTEVLEEIGDQQVIIWGNFHYEIEMIKSLLGDKAVTLYGGTADKEASIVAFKDGSAQYLIAHPRSAAYGLTFVNCHTQVFFSLDYSFETYEQAKSRTHRAGQVNKCTYIHILCENSIDETILKVLRRKGSADEMVYEFVRDNERV